MLLLDLSMMTIQVMLVRTVRSITIAGTTWRKERKHKGEETKTSKVSGGEVEFW